MLVLPPALRVWWYVYGAAILRFSYRICQLILFSLRLHIEDNTIRVANLPKHHPSSTLSLSLVFMSQNACHTFSRVCILCCGCRFVAQKKKKRNHTNTHSRTLCSSRFFIFQPRFPISHMTLKMQCHVNVRDWKSRRYSHFSFQPRTHDSIRIPFFCPIPPLTNRLDIDI